MYINETVYERENLDRDDIFKFLNTIRDSGRINMFASAPYIMSKFDVSKTVAKQIVLDYMSQ